MVADAESPTRLLRIDRRAGTPIFDQLVDQIRAMVAGSVLQPGDRLPTVRQLAADLGINRNTAAKAYGLLREEGLIVTRSGGGSRIAEGPRRLAAREKRAHIRESVDRLALEAEQLGIVAAAIARVIKGR